MNDAMVQELLRGCDTVLPREQLIERLSSGKPLTVKAGFDPTASNLHLGHTVLLNKLRQFQAMGHRVVFLIGGFTAMIGDPTGKSATRPPLSAEEVALHAKTYTEQVFKVLDPGKTEVVNNAAWLEKLSAADLIRLASQSTVARMLERDDFSQRYQGGQAIAIHEFLYPLLMGYDSVVLEADLELGGTDQTFNLLMGRELQRQAGQEPQAIMTLPLLVGLDGHKKMSKSLGNTVELTDSADEMFGKLMSISDALMWDYWELLSFEPLEVIANHRQDVQQGKNPRDVKWALALELVGRYHGSQAAKAALANFQKRFAQHQLPEDLPTQTLALPAAGLPLANTLKALGLVASSSDGVRMIRQGAVRLNQERQNSNITLHPQDQPVIIQVGKRRLAKVQLTAS